MCGIFKVQIILIIHDIHIGSTCLIHENVKMNKNLQSLVDDETVVTKETVVKYRINKFENVTNILDEFIPS